MGESISVTESVDADAMLARVALEMRTKIVAKALRAAGTVVVNRAKELCPVGQSRVGKKEGKKHLRDTIGMVNREYSSGIKMLVVGTEYPAGAQGHLVEHGHQEVLFGKPTGRRVPPHPFLRPAADETKSEQIAAFEHSLKSQVEAVEKTAR